MQHGDRNTVIKMPTTASQTPILTIGLTANAKTDFHDAQEYVRTHRRISNSGGINEIAGVFQKVIIHLPAKRSHLDSICLPAGTYSGAITVNISQPQSNSSGIVNNVISE